MARLDQFEYPLPVVSADVDKIEIHTSGNCKGAFSIENKGGGTLSGRITSNSRCIRFVPEYFDKNRTEVKYFINTDIYKKGEVIQTSALIKSNGGEVVIPVTVSITPPEIELPDGHKIVTLSDFYDYCTTFPATASALFFKDEFRSWLANIGFLQLELYDLFIKDEEKARAVDNFLVLAGLKEKAEIVVCDTSVNVFIEPGEKSVLTGEIQFRTTGPGYVKGRLVVPKDCPFLSFSQTEITEKDFAGSDVISINYFIEPAKISKEHTTSKILLKTAADSHFYIHTVFRHVLKAETSKEYFKWEDDGFLIVENHSGRDLLLDISASESYLKFEGKKYYVPSAAKIPFQVKVSRFQGSLLKKQPETSAFITIKTNVFERVYTRRVEVHLSNLPEII